LSDEILFSMLDNWKRWARGAPGTYQSLLGRLYVPSPDEIDKDTGEWVGKSRPARMPIDELQALKVERAILRLPRRPFDAPRLIVYHHLTPGKSHAYTCRRLGVKVYQYEETLGNAHNQLKRELGL
jgi:hypothetical protein